MGLAGHALHRRWESRPSLGQSRSFRSGEGGGSGLDTEANTQSLPHMRRTTGGSGEFQRDARRASAFWVFSWNESGLTGLRYGLALRVAHVGRSIIKLVGCTCIPPESFVNFQRELLRGPMSIRAGGVRLATRLGGARCSHFGYVIN